jgi:hypothetical protein
MKMKTYKFLFFIIIIALSFGGCRYSVIVPFEEDGGGDPNNPDTTEVSFSADIEPIFNDGNYCTSCHGGKQAPDLRTGKAYASLNSTKYLNLATPAESRIYKHPHPDTNEHLQKKYNSPQASKVLSWIQQGAKNN